MFLVIETKDATRGYLGWVVSSHYSKKRALKNIKAATQKIEKVKNGIYCRGQLI